MSKIIGKKGLKRTNKLRHKTFLASLSTTACLVPETFTEFRVQTYVKRHFQIRQTRHWKYWRFTIFHGTFTSPMTHEDRCSPTFTAVVASGVCLTWRSSSLLKLVLNSVVLLLRRFQTKAIKNNLPCYSTHNFGEKRLSLYLTQSIMNSTRIRTQLADFSLRIINF